MSEAIQLSRLFKLTYTSHSLELFCFIVLAFYVGTKTRTGAEAREIEIPSKSISIRNRDILLSGITIG